MKKVILTLTAAFMLCATYTFGQDGRRIEAESFSETNKATTKAGDGGTIVNNLGKDSWIKFDDVDFGEGATSITFRASGGPQNKPKLQVRLGDEKGKLLGTVQFPEVSWSEFKNYTLKIPKTEGKQTITVVSIGGAVLLNWIELN